MLIRNSSHCTKVLRRFSQTCLIPVWNVISCIIDIEIREKVKVCSTRFWCYCLDSIINCIFLCDYTTKKQKNINFKNLLFWIYSQKLGEQKRNATALKILYISIFPAFFFNKASYKNICRNSNSPNKISNNKTNS